MLHGQAVHPSGHPAPSATVTADDAVADAWNRHQAELTRHAFRLSRDAEVAADLVQDAFIRLVDEVRAGRQPANVRAWLFRVTTNASISRNRRDRVAAQWVARQPGLGSADGPELTYLERERALEVESLLAGVSEDERRALLLSAHGVSGEQIAVALGRSHLATRALLCRARGRLRQTASPASTSQAA